MSGGVPETLEEVHAYIWMLLGAGVRDRKSAFHAPTLATVDADGRPQARTVILREADMDARHLRFNTDTRAPKHAQMFDGGPVALHVYDPDAKIQVRFHGRVRLHAGDQRARDVWDAMKSMSRECYRQGCPPGTPLDSVEDVPRDTLDDLQGFANMAVADVTIERIDWLYLRHEGHMRAGFDLTAEPVAMTWLAP
ncbi:pyridoxamine 5'-phosphate oxidase family protein [Tepidamorphus sp. 3E244]|uniref:pyridoxamine 5'-phosphate oxidase family protein n=1 Tax=Tepidamorphus sp. 3E244 TaxID=3385498 RepID=UPI0038FC3539